MLKNNSFKEKAVSIESIVIYLKAKRDLKKYLLFLLLFICFCYNANELNTYPEIDSSKLKTKNATLAIVFPEKPIFRLDNAEMVVFWHKGQSDINLSEKEVYKSFINDLCSLILENTCLSTVTGDSIINRNFYYTKHMIKDETGVDLDIEVPTAGSQITLKNSEPDYILILSELFFGIGDRSITFPSGGTISSFSHKMFWLSSKYIIWSTSERQAVTFGYAEGSEGYMGGIDKDDWKDLVFSYFESVFEDTPFEK